MKGQLPADNSTMFQMFFREHVTHLTDKFSSFVSDNSFSFVGFFWPYIMGIGILLSVLILSDRVKSNKMIKSATTGERSRTVLKIVRLSLLTIIVLLSFWSLVKSY
jgi:hypothetical protein